MTAAKQVFLIWDLDGAIGQINSTFPYNFEYRTLESELENVSNALNLLRAYGIRSTFAITGFSGEEGKYPYVFPELIDQISMDGHEIASHSWRHEWMPLFTRAQVEKSLIRSKLALENCIGGRQEVVGFVPPHNRPMTWLGKGAISLGDRGVFPFFKMGDSGQLLNVLRSAGYKWVRLSHQNLLQKLGVYKRNMTGKAYFQNGLLILENHYAGFDKVVVEHILNSKFSTFTVSAHPLMLSFQNKAENRANLECFLEALSKEVEFTTPGRYISTSSRKSANWLVHEAKS